MIICVPSGKGKSEIPYELEDLQRTLAEVTDSTEFAEDFFRHYIYNSDMVDLGPLFAEAGFQLRKENPGSAVIQFGEAKIDFSASSPTISQNTIIGSPLYKAGIDRGDKLLSLGGAAIRNARELQRILATHEPGDTLAVTYESLGVEYENTVTLAEDQTLQLIPYEETGMDVKEEMKTFRESWLGSKGQR